MKRFLMLFLGITLVISSANLAKAENALDELMKPEGEIKLPGKLSFHGYGELHYNSSKADANVPAETGKDSAARMDFHRMVWGLSYHYNDMISLHTEVDFEHAANEIELEFAYLDFLINPAINVRAGAMLMPVGPLNEFHEPPLFYSVERPYVQNAIIPTTWQEGGAGIFGSPLPGLKYRLYVVSGLNGSKFRASDGIRKGRGKVAGGEVQPLSGDELAVVGRLEYTAVPGLTLGGSAYSGGANQEADPALDGVGVTIFEGDIRYRKFGLDLTGVYTQIDIDDAEKINAKTGELVGEKLVGWYVEGAYDILRPLALQSEKRLMAFVRYEQINTQDEVPTGFTADPKNDRNVITYGLAYYPITSVAIKADVENWENEAATNNDGNRFNLAVAYMF
ncbi:MAG: hypothetical protein AAB090_07240 [Nitrospirota bacterium]